MSSSLSVLALPRFTKWHNEASLEDQVQFAELIANMPGKMVRNENGLFHLVTNETSRVNQNSNQSIEDNKKFATMSLCSKVALTVLALIASLIIGAMALYVSFSLIFNQI